MRLFYTHSPKFQQCQGCPRSILSGMCPVCTRPFRHLPPTPQLRVRTAPGAETSLRAPAACPKPRRNATLQSSSFIQRLQIQSFALFFLSRRSPVSFILMPLRTLFMPREAVAPSHLHSDLVIHLTLLLPPIPTGSESCRGPGQGHSTFAISVAVTPLEATPAIPPISVASKRLTENVNPLEATLTKNRGEGHRNKSESKIALALRND
jgi:hypothetical protein